VQNKIPAKIIDRLTRLFALGDAVADTPEGANARARALETAGKLGLTEGQARALVATEGRAPEGATVYRYPLASRAHWRQLLAWAIRDYAGVNVILTKSPAGCFLSIVGRGPDFELWRDLFVRAEAEIDRKALAYVAEHKGGKTASDSFRKGAATGFRDLLREWRFAAEKSPAGDAMRAAAEARGAATTALVMPSRAAEVAVATAKAFPRLSQVSTGSAKSSAAQRAGYAEGRSLGVARGSLT
jgi:hypothetical protein